MTDPVSPTAATTAPATVPNRGGATFDADIYAWWAWESAAVPEFNALATNSYTNATAANEKAVAAASSASTATTQAGTATTQAAAAAASALTALNAPGTTATSTTSLTVATGAQSLTIQTGKTIVPGMEVIIAYTTDPTIRMVGTVTAYTTGTGALAVTVTSKAGTGTYTDWTVSLTAAATPFSGGSLSSGLNEARGSVAMHATTMDLWAQPNIIDGTDSAATVTAIVNAPQAGARRVLYPAAGSVITNGATFAVDGAANHTAAAGDKWEFEAITTDTYKVHVTKADGTAVIGGAVGDHQVTVHTANGHGSTNTKIVRFTTTQSSAGSAITYADSAANGGSFTINTSGIYAIAYTDGNGSREFGISKNSAQLTSSVSVITAANRLAYAAVSADIITVSTVAMLAANDVIRAHDSGGATLADERCRFNITRIA